MIMAKRRFINRVALSFRNRPVKKGHNTVDFAPSLFIVAEYICLFTGL